MGRIITRPRTPIDSQIQQGSRIRHSGEIEINWDDPITDGLVLCTRYDEKFGNPTNMVYPNDQGTILANAEWAWSGVRIKKNLANSAVTFDSRSEYQYNNGKSIFAGVTMYTIEDYYNLISKSDAEQINTYEWALGFHAVGNTIRCVVDQGNPNFQANTSLVANRQYNAGLVASLTQCTLYLDGKEDGASARTPGTPYADTNPIQIGTLNRLTSTYHLDGVVHYSYIFDRVLTPQEARRITSNPNTFFKDAHSRPFVYPQVAPPTGLPAGTLATMGVGR